MNKKKKKKIIKVKYEGVIFTNNIWVFTYNF